MSHLDVALEMVRAGLCVLPARTDSKRPALPGWKAYQERLPTEDEVHAWFTESGPMCIVTGEVSGQLEMIDFDAGGESFERWSELVRAEIPEVFAKLVIERTPSGGRHVVYHCAAGISANLKLAQRRIVVPNATPVVLYGKTYVPRKVGDEFEVTLTLIETRGEGGLFLCDPSPGYELVHGDFLNVPKIEPANRETLLRAAWSLDELPPVALPDLPPGDPCGRPGDDFNDRGDVRELLERHGWVCVQRGENEYWRRPGKESGWSTTLKAGVFYVFSANAAPFEPNQGYSKFGVYARLEHGGDFRAAATALRTQGFGQQAVPDPGVDLSKITKPATAVESGEATLLDAGAVLVVVRSGILQRTLPIAITTVQATINQDIKALRPSSIVTAEFVANFLRARTQEILDTCCKSGTTVANIELPRFWEYPFPLPPLAEQRRIVAKIEELTARSRAARAALAEVPTLLEQFRQSVLASAFRGDLTADWRAKHEHVVAEDWFSKIVGERGPETEKAHLWGSGRTLDEVRPEWGDLPEDWRWVRVKELGFDTKDVVQIGPMSMKSNEFIDSGVTVLNVGCVQRGYLDLSKANFLPSDRAKDFSRYRVTENDIVFTRSGSVGRCSMVPAALHDALITFHLLRVRTSPEICLPEYLLFAFQGAGCVANQIEESSIGATRAGFNTRLLEEMWIPLPPPIEQEVIVTQIREVDSRVSTLSESMTETLETLSSLDQSILAKAFRGELVPQDPADEPASVLLERLRTSQVVAITNGTAVTRKKRNGKS